MSAFTQQLAADGSTEQMNVPQTGDHVVFATGDFGGGTLSFEASYDGGVTWLTIEEMTVAARVVRFISSDEIVRATLSGATAPDITIGVI